MALNPHTNGLTLKDCVFERGRACLKPDVLNAIAAVQSQLCHFLIDNTKTRTLVERYTDNLLVYRPVLDCEHFCTIYEDNLTFSVACAREARRALIDTFDADAARRIVVAGYGGSRPLQGSTLPIQRIGEWNCGFVSRMTTEQLPITKSVINDGALISFPIRRKKIRQRPPPSVLSMLAQGATRCASLVGPKALAHMLLGPVHTI